MFKQCIMKPIMSVAVMALLVGGVDVVRTATPADNNRMTAGLKLPVVNSVPVTINKHS
jgi:hypothetical protein